MSQQPDLGTKRVCVSCGARFYDLDRPTAICPKCGTAQPDLVPRLRRTSDSLISSSSNTTPAQKDEDDLDLGTDTDTDADADLDDAPELDDDDDDDDISSDIDVTTDKEDHDS
ncbi:MULTISPECIES: FYDLN acid domain-containing protein [Acetobacter]|uniref:FYDLN acid domain-containing protein n=1 Tax=Acetobacter thailandicus TaxID=1502842 RepID=A0ABT3QDW0_9PROT|nr:MULTISPECIES: FYDLN acid domain-containing protein [Acetobacter]MBS0961042.1 FYDLN acid domain-containing protein [Acetobacter thailandicus]MBS0981114.1 FYDLN acid domain-containing protein [Acetobacter thailandicus]MBS0986401.1 FYDLN acid domain-containing protein [Acetobacter thailandicus]MBS1004587.1 FYDLN acid domain-containing protein [Acetobacter thailandicus]MCX2563482.1 FYDLN acid domain-containing protein [Acetobacter thailandicus]